MSSRRLQDIKSIYRVTGTPENYLTALRASTWGFKEDLENRWKSLHTGDIIFFHSSKTSSHFLKKNELESRVIGFGVVGEKFFIGTTPLWIEEFEENRVLDPYRFNFSEIYFFTEVSINETWDSQSLKKHEATAALLRKLLAAGIPLNQMPNFPKMGSYSIINDEETKNILIKGTQGLYGYRTPEEESDIIPGEQSLIREVNSKDEILRFATGVTPFEDIGARVRKMDEGHRQVDIAKLQSAENAHANILTGLFEHLKERGYQCFKNNHIDLLAVHEGEKKSLLIEAKSNENNNFHAQARKGIVQLFEYNYFEMNKFKTQNNLALTQEHSVLAFSRRVQDEDYIRFINSLKIRAITVSDHKIAGLGDLLNFSDLAG
jgi:hypothetical protein